MKTYLTRLMHSKPPTSSDIQDMPKSWAERHAPLATIIAAYSTLLAVIIAGLGYYFTVIPLYQKAALDELIAKREVELKEAQTSIVVARREAYEQQRANFGHAIEQPATDCSGIPARFTRPSTNPMDQAEKLSDHQRKIQLGIEVVPCLAAVLLKYDAEGVLAQNDSRYMALLFAKIGAELDRKRVEAILQIAEIPSLAVSDPSVLVPVGAHAQSADDSVTEWREQMAEIGFQYPALEDRSQERFQYQVRLTQVQIADDYRLSALRTLRETVREMQWPKE